MIDSLTQEIIKTILQSVGVSDKGNLNLGLYSKELLTNRYLEFEYEDLGKIKHNIYAGEISLEDFNIRGLIIDCSISNDNEFIFIWKVADNLINSIRYSWNFPKESSFQWYDEKHKRWINLDLYTKALSLAGFARLVSAGLLWAPCSNFEELLLVSQQLLA